MIAPVDPYVAHVLAAVDAAEKREALRLDKLRSERKHAEELRLARHSCEWGTATHPRT